MIAKSRRVADVRAARAFTAGTGRLKRLRAARSLLRTLGGELEDDAASERDVRYAGTGDEPGPDPVVTACTGALSHLPYAFTFTELVFPPFNTLLRPRAANANKLDAIEGQFQEARDAYADNPRKWFGGVIFEMDTHHYLYTDQPLEEIEGLDFLRFSDHDRPRAVASLEAFVLAHHHKQ